MKEIYPKPVYVDDGKQTFQDADGSLWPVRFKYACSFHEGLARVNLEDGWTFVDKNHNFWPERFKGLGDLREGLAPVVLEDGVTFVDKDHNIWPERFKDLDYFSEGFAPVKLEDGWTFVDKEHNIWPKRFVGVNKFDKGLASVLGEYKNGWSFVDKNLNIWPSFSYEQHHFRLDLESRKGVVPVKLNDGKYTFVDFDKYNIWTERFELIDYFSEGLAAVRLEDGWTFIDKAHNIWPERFKHAFSFSEGLAAVRLEDGWTFIDKAHNIWPERFKHTFYFSKGLAPVELEDGSKRFVDKEHRVYLEEEAEALKKIYNNPELFLELPTESFKDENFIQGAILQVKDALIKPILRQETVDDEYEKACLELLEKCKEKTQKERQIIEQRQKENAKKEKVIKSIKEFNL